MSWFLRPLRDQSLLMRTEQDPLASLQREINRALGDWMGGSTSRELAGCSLAPRMDVKEDAKAFYVTADLPGMTEKDIDLSFEDGLLTLRGEKKIEREEKNQTWQVIERASGNLARTLALPTIIDSEKIDAKFEKGVLSITLPKQAPEQAKTTKISIKAA